MSEHHAIPSGSGVVLNVPFTLIHDAGATIHEYKLESFEAGAIDRKLFMAPKVDADKRMIDGNAAKNTKRGQVERLKIINSSVRSSMELLEAGAPRGSVSSNWQNYAWGVTGALALGLIVEFWKRRSIK